VCGNVDVNVNVAVDIVALANIVMTVDTRSLRPQRKPKIKKGVGVRVEAEAGASQEAACGAAHARSNDCEVAAFCRTNSI